MTLHDRIEELRKKVQHHASKIGTPEFSSEAAADADAQCRDLLFGDNLEVLRDCESALSETVNAFGGVRPDEWGTITFDQQDMEGLVKKARAALARLSGTQEAKGM